MIDTYNYEGVGDCDKMVRMDYVFNDVVFQKMFRNKVENLETSGTDLGNKKCLR